MSNIVQKAIVHSNFLARLLQSQQVKEDELNQLAQSPLPENFFTDFAYWNEIIDNKDEEELKKQLRRLRAITFAQILVRDLTQLGDLDEVMQVMTDLADFSLLQAQQLAEKQYAIRYGQPIGAESGQIQHLTIIAMGKMGGHELNASSDIDLVFTFPENGITNGKKEITNQEFFSKVAKKIICIIDDITEHGRVFRVDTRLRPNGDSGAIVISEIGLENYLLRQGREWERYAWIKARVVSPYPNDIQNLITPFIYRKYLDFNSVHAMRGLHQQIQQEISSEELDDNIKVGLGGIREIEFIAQIFQMIRGGQLTELQLKGTRETLRKLQELEILDNQQTETLLTAYAFLRNLEHRLQYMDDQQTQKLPTQAEEQTLIAKSMRFDSYPEFLTELNFHRNNVNNLFIDIFHDNDSVKDMSGDDLELVWQGIHQTEKKVKVLKQYSLSEPEKMVKSLQEFKQSASYAKVRPTVQDLFDALIPKYIQFICKLNSDNVSQTDGNTLERIIEFSKTISGRSSYLALLNEYPVVIGQLISIMSQSRWMSDYLSNHPILLDELISSQLLDTHFDWNAEKQNLIRALKLISNDVEQEMDIVRKFQHSFVFRLAVQELKGLWTVERLSDQLSALADIILEVSLEDVWHNYKKTHREVPKFGIIAYGKLGGKELTYNSDLDLVYLYDDPHPESNEIYTWFSSRLTSFLSAPTSSGNLYEVDLRLRPNGEAGFLATKLEAFETYQHQHAWIWEHQALTRARFIAGDPKIEKKFNQIRKEILMLEREPNELKQEIISMRNKILASHPAQFDNVKHSRGGLADVEFIVQYIVLAYAHQFPDLTQNLGNIALLRMAAGHGIIDSKLAKKARNAYRNYRKIAHNTVLHDTPPAINIAQLQDDYNAVRQLWDKVFI